MSMRSLAAVSFLVLVGARGDDVHYTTGSSAPSIPFEMLNRHVGLTAKIEHHPMAAVLDTGASGLVLDAAQSAALGLKNVGSQHAHGAGGVEAGGVVGGVNIALPGFELRDQRMGTLPLSALSAQSGRPLHAILGYPLLARCVVEIDYQRQTLALHDPSSYAYRGSGIVVPLTFKQDLPYVAASLVLPDGRSISGKFLIDTGASTYLILAPEAVEREDVMKALTKTVTVGARGVGGARDLTLARLSRFELAGLSFDKPVAAIQPAGPGRISAPGTIGNIGGGILSRFKVIFDYSRRQMILEPGPDVAKPFEADMSGLGLSTLPPEYRRLTVSKITDGSPAVEAGIKVGDEIESIDGTPAAQLRLSDLRERLRIEGQQVQIGLLRGGERLTVSLRTKRLV